MADRKKKNPKIKALTAETESKGIYGERERERERERIIEVARKWFKETNGKVWKKNCKRNWNTPLMTCQGPNIVWERGRWMS